MDGAVFFSFPHGALPFLSVSFTIISDDGKKASRIPLQQKNARAVKPGRCAFQLTLFFEELLLFAFTGGDLGGFRVYLSHFGSCTAKTVLAAAELAVIDNEVRDIIMSQYDKAKTILNDNMAKVHKVAQKLFVEEKISGEDFRAIMQNEAEQ